MAQRAAKDTVLDKPGWVSALLEALYETRAYEQFAVLAARIAAHVGLDNTDNASRLLGVLRETDAKDQADILVGRLPAEGLFNLYCEQTGHQLKYRFGRQPDGTPASPWSWDDLN